MKNDQLQCLICYKWYSHLGSHIAKGHKILAREYKMQFGLILKQPLISQTIKAKKQAAYAEDRQYYLDNILKAGKRYRFKKGHYKKSYYSRDEMDKAQSQLDKINSRKPQNCPMCNMETRHLESHLYNAHGFLYMKKGVK